MSLWRNFRSEVIVFRRKLCHVIIYPRPNIWQTTLLKANRDCIGILNVINFDRSPAVDLLPTHVRIIVVIQLFSGWKSILMRYELEIFYLSTSHGRARSQYWMHLKGFPIGVCIWWGSIADLSYEIGPQRSDYIPHTFFEYNYSSIS